MGQKSIDMDKILELFYENPNQRFTIRQISFKTKIPKSTVHKYLIELKKEDLVDNNQASGSNLFKTKKTHFFIEKMFNIGLIDYLIDELNPSCIILFGSFRKGESDKESDIDLFIEISKKDLPSLLKFEKKINHKIQLFAETDINKLPDRLFNNIVNGIKLYGVFKIR